MAVLEAHVPWYERILALPGVLRAPVLLIGLQDVCVPEKRLQPAGPIPRRYAARDLATLLRAEGIAPVTTLDLFDPRADVRHDMNTPIPESERARYGTVIDIGSIEHVFDTRQCLENYANLLGVGGVLVLHTCVRGYFRHGLHTFHPDVLRAALELNGFHVALCAYSSWDGLELQDPNDAADVLVWLVAEKGRATARFQCPQQDGWSAHYQASPEQGGASHVVRLLKRYLYPLTPPILADLYRWLRRRRRPRLVAEGLERR